MGQWVVHIVGTHIVEGEIPDGVLFGEQVRQELHRRHERHDIETEYK